MSVACGCNSLANIDRIKPTIRSDFSLDFHRPFYSFLSLSLSLFYFIFSLSLVRRQKLLVEIHRGSMLFHFCFRKRKQHVSAVYLPADDEYIDSTIRRTHTTWCRVLFCAHPFQASKNKCYGDHWCTKLSVLFLFFIIAVSGVSDDIGERIYLTEIYVSMLEIRKWVDA